MLLKTKKIIAREFLLILSCFLLSGVIVGIVSLYTVWLNHRIDNTWQLIYNNNKQETEIRSEYTQKINERNELMKSLKEKLSFNNLTIYELWDKTLYYYTVDSISYRWENVWDDNFKLALATNGIYSVQNFKLYIKSHSLTKMDISSKEKADELLKERNILKSIHEELRSKLPSLGIAEIFLIALLIISVLLFPIRYLVYAILWSLKILKKSE